jgi:hypothetical protein
MKTCFKCGASKELEHFYKHPMMADGHLNKCAECTKADTRAHRAERVEFYKAYDRARAKEPHRVEARAAYKPSTVRPPESDPAKRAARTAVSNAVRDGRLTRSPECEVCTTICNTQGHHDDYSKPLDVIWCCTACHALIHSYWRAQERSAA